MRGINDIKFWYRIKNKKTKEVKEEFLSITDIEMIGELTYFEIISRDEYVGYSSNDKRDIYEGYKLKVAMYTRENKIEVYEGEVIFDSGTFSLRIDKVITGMQYDVGQTPPLYEFFEREIIGNIYENDSTNIIIEN